MTYNEIALQLIEDIASHAMTGADTPEQRALSSIYRYAHCSIGKCTADHAEWKKAVDAEVFAFDEDEYYGE